MQKKGTTQPSKILKIYRGKEIVSLETYLSNSELWSTQESQALVSFVNPHKVFKSHKPQPSFTVSRWLKEVLPLAGIDTRMFKCHSTQFQVRCDRSLCLLYNETRAVV